MLLRIIVMNWLKNFGEVKKDIKSNIIIVYICLERYCLFTEHFLNNDICSSQQFGNIGKML